MNWEERHPGCNTRDAYLGAFINLYHVKEDGWVKHGFSDTNPIFWKTKLEKGEYSNVIGELG